VKTTYKTGVEIEALTAVATTLITIWDMVKEYEKDQQGQYPDTEIEEIRIIKKTKV
jgi:cyclic pyranopterin phosphate synthase